jgi:hypothetical protein
MKRKNGIHPFRSPKAARYAVHRSARFQASDTPDILPGHDMSSPGDDAAARASRAAAVKLQCCHGISSSTRILD